ncbi:hypothetical protein IGJ83_002674 [Enterococcus pernyi]|uniref:hypothetical protein n=1 Tax=unclassified Enterococcus TaxID=2608891 RepID=UPI001D218DD3|nr:hypothetical protein [Enterococcus faecium]
MDWNAVFSDLHEWMKESNQMTQHHPITSDQYWEWLIKSMGELGNKYNNHPLVLGFLNAIITFQDENVQKLKM